ncbi:hypothetical protein BS78_05G139600 [Paspalum vaginatum]|nr:hypothetical protein BS78_05G139600 [Paspalum vaginatum]
MRAVRSLPSSHFPFPRAPPLLPPGVEGVLSGARAAAATRCNTLTLVAAASGVFTHSGLSPIRWSGLEAGDEHEVAARFLLKHHTLDGDLGRRPVSLRVAGPHQPLST